MNSKSIDHLGLVAGMFDELKIQETIDNYISQDLNQRNISIGECVKAMVLNGLGFVNSQLYLVSDFLEDKPIEKLFGRDINSSFFNDDVLGRALDELYSNDICQLFTKISTKACQKLGLKNQTYHLDSTSFHTHGKHINNNLEDDNVIELVKGYSRDHHPELNQVILELIASNTSGIPLAMKALSGNKSDNKEFPKIIKSFVKNLDYTELEPITFVADSALYTKENISNLPKELKFISRVPERCKEIKEEYKKLDINELERINEKYSFKEIEINYAEKKQRWIILLSKPSQKRKLKTYEKKLKKKIRLDTKKILTVSKKEFACKEDLLKEVSKLEKKLKYQVISSKKISEINKYPGKGRPKKNAKPKIFYKVDFETIRDHEKIAEEKSKLGLFTIATNHLKNYSAEEILSLYKDQGKVERGFRFLKDNTFIASSLYLEKPQRIEALMFIMCLCLMVYSAIEHRVRYELKEKNLTYKNQVKKNVQNPTTRWIFYNFLGVHVLYMEGKTKILNLKSKHRLVISLLGKKYKKYYS